MGKQPESPAEMFQRTLQIDEVLAKKLVDGGLSTLEEVAYVPFGELREVGGLWEEETTALRNRARQYLLNQAMTDPLEGQADA
jgi:transcription termination/antitermination protein NusA